MMHAHSPIPKNPLNYLPKSLTGPDHRDATMVGRTLIWGRKQLCPSQFKNTGSTLALKRQQKCEVIASCNYRIYVHNMYVLSLCANQYLLVNA